MKKRTDMSYIQFPGKSTAHLPDEKESNTKKTEQTRESPFFFFPSSHPLSSLFLLSFHFIKKHATDAGKENNAKRFKILLKT